MKQDSKSLYKALLARDARFDGLFFVAVTSTRIYCRPICPVKPPQEKNCRFYDTAPEAEQAGFRPCLRCRPELAPGLAPVDRSQWLAQNIVRRLEEHSPDEGADLESIAAEFQLSSRQIRRVIQNELGVAPIQLLLTRRLLLAKQLLTETQLSVIQVAFACGFGSLRRFNDAFRIRYGMPPTRLRRNAIAGALVSSANETSTLQLSYRPPYDWSGVLAFLKARELKGVEHVTGEFYARTVRIANCQGWIRVGRAEKKNALMVEFTHSLTPVLPALLNRLRDLFDLTARPEIIAKHLARDKTLRPLIKANPGLRVPGAFAGFELSLRAILGQQVTVKSATTIAGRFASAFGEMIVTPFPELNRLSPTAETIVRQSVGDIAKLGIISNRSKSILALAQAHQSGKLNLDSGDRHHPDKAIACLCELPGIGPWTAQYISMRALRWPDAFPKEDIVIRNFLGGVSASQAEEISQSWRPWRSYAVLHLWRASAAKAAARKPAAGPKD